MRKIIVLLHENTEKKKSILVFTYCFSADRQRIVEGPCGLSGCLMFLTSSDLRYR